MNDVDNADLDDLTLAGGWKLLCMSLIGHCIHGVVEDRNVFRRARMRLDKAPPCNEARWMQGGVGTIQFEEVCELLGESPEFVRRKIEEYAHARRRDKPQGVPW